MNFFKRLPLPVYGVMVALAGLGNLMADRSMAIKYFCGACALLVGILLVIKLFLCRDIVVNDLQNPVIRSVSPTFGMACIMLSTYLAQGHRQIGIVLWYLATAFTAFIILSFAGKFLFPLRIMTVFPTWFAASAGMIVASVTSGFYGQALTGKICFYIGFAANVLLLPIVAYRMFKVRQVPVFAKPTYYIFGAPFSLSLAGYIAAFGADARKEMVILLLCIAVPIMIASLIALPFVMQKAFSPAMAGYAFTSTIMALAAKIAIGYVTNVYQWIIPGGIIIIRVMEVFAFCMVYYTLIRFLGFAFKTEAVEVKKAVSNDSQYDRSSIKEQSIK